MSREDPAPKREANMSKFSIPTINDIAKFQAAALDHAFAKGLDEGATVRLADDDAPEDFVGTTINRSRKYKVVTHVQAGSSPVVAVLVCIKYVSYRGIESDVWYTYYNDEWHSALSWSSFPDDARYSLLV